MALALVDFLGLRFDPQHQSPVVFLKDSNQEKYLPVWIGVNEATSIELAAGRRTAPRPLTHDLLATLLRNLGASVRKLIIDRLEEKTYYATLFVEHDGGVREVDCRPSDGIALALREDAPIYVDEDLMYNIRFVELSEQDALDAALAGDPELAGDDDEEDEDDGPPAQVLQDEGAFQDFLKRISPSDFKGN
jgi:uncharacterized protein